MKLSAKLQNEKQIRNNNIKAIIVALNKFLNNKKQKFPLKYEKSLITNNKEIKKMVL